MCTIEIYVFAFLPALTRSLAKYLLIKNYLKEKLLKRLRLFSTIISHILLASFMWCRLKIYLNFTFFFVAARALTDWLVNSSTSGERMNERDWSRSSGALNRVVLEEEERVIRCIFCEWN